MWEEKREKMGERKVRPKMHSTVEREEKYRWKTGRDGSGGVPKLSTDPCRNRCI